MALDFPTSPSDGDSFVSSNVTYVYSETKGIWYSRGNVNLSAGGGGASVTIANTSPETPSEGDLYWDEELGKLFIYYSDDDTDQWVEVSGTGVVSGGTESGVSYVNGANGNVTLTTDNIQEGNNLYFSNSRAVGALTAGESITIEANGLVTVTVSEIDLGSVSQNIIPSTNEVYSLGSSDNRWKDLFLSGNTIVLGDLAIKAANGSLSTSVVEGNGYIVPAEIAVGTSAYDSNTTSEGFFALPAGNTNSRLEGAANGHVRVNTDYNTIELFYDGLWSNVVYIGTNPSIGYLGSNIFTTIAGVSNIYGQNFGSELVTVRYTYSSNLAVEVQTYPITDTLISVNIPSQIYNQPGGTNVTIYVNKDGIYSNGFQTVIGDIPLGGIVTSSNGYIYHTFTSSGTLEVPSGTTLNVDYLIVGGGGGSTAHTNSDAGGAGGGAGGAVRGNTTVNSNVTVTVGAGGGPSAGGSLSSAPVLTPISALGGGRGGSYNGQSAGNGGSGGGGWYPSNAGGTGTPGQGYNGGTGAIAGGGGGGAGAAGSAGSPSDIGGAGGIGINWMDLGTYYAGGGGGGGRSPSYGGRGGAGGLGGGGNGSGNNFTPAYVPENGDTNTGGGAGGGSYSPQQTASGGSGVVIIRYPSSNLS